MPNFAVVLKDEVRRLARKEIKAELAVTRKASAQYRRDIAELKRQMSALQRRIGAIEKQVQKDVPSPVAVAEADAERVRFTAKGLRSQRKRLDLSAADYGRLIGVTDQTIYNWEREAARPRKQQLAQIASLRGIGKKEARARLEKLAAGRRKRQK